MATVKVTHLCGHERDHNFRKGFDLHGRTPQRLEGMDCYECNLQKKRTSDKERYEESLTAGWPALIGRDNDVIWAGRIRADRIHQLQTCPKPMGELVECCLKYWGNEKSPDDAIVRAWREKLEDVRGVITAITNPALQSASIQAINGYVVEQIEAYLRRSTDAYTYLNTRHLSLFEMVADPSNGLYRTVADREEFFLLFHRMAISATLGTPEITTPMIAEQRKEEILQAKRDAAQAAQRQAEEAAARLAQETLRPETTKTDITATLTVDDNHIYVATRGKCQITNDTIKPLGFSWDVANRVWSRRWRRSRVGALAQVAKALLQAGVVVRIPDEAARTATVTGEFTPDAARFVVELAGDYSGCFGLAWWPCADCYDAARQIGRKDRRNVTTWSSPYVVIPASALSELQEFAAKNNVWFAPSAVKLVERLAKDVQILEEAK